VSSTTRVDRMMEIAAGVDAERKATRGYMGGDVAGGCDLDDADREPECEECRGAERPCAKCSSAPPGKPTPPAILKDASYLPSPGESFWVRCDVAGGWQKRKMERYCSVGFDDDHGFEHRLSDLGDTWRLTAPPTTLTEADESCGSVSDQGLMCLMPKGHDGEHCGIPATGAGLISSRVCVSSEGWFGHTERLEASLNEAASRYRFRDALAHIACLCSAIETQSPSVTNE